MQKRPRLLIRTLSTLGLAGLAAFVLPGCNAPMRTVSHVDLTRYQGDWYVIANIPYWLEDGKVATFDRYRLRPDGTMDNEYWFRRGSFDAPEEVWRGTAWVHDTTTNAEWRVRFWWPLSADYLVIDLDPDYRWAAIGHPSRDYFWILARDRQLDPEIQRGILERAALQGYDTSKVKPVPQPPPAR
jgi:apolipoprotein D and lipocalin family protein